MAEKLIDLGELRRSAQDLATIAQDLNMCSVADSELSGAVGDAGLASSVDGFQTSWTEERNWIADEIGALAAALSATADGFEQADQNTAELIAKSIVDTAH